MCVPAGRGSKWHKRRTVATIATNRQVYLREEAHAFPQRVNPGYTGVIGHHAKRVPLQIEPATFMSRPTRDTGGYEPLLKAPLAKITVRPMDGVVAPMAGIELSQQLTNNRRLILPHPIQQRHVNQHAASLDQRIRFRTI